MIFSAPYFLVAILSFDAICFGHPAGGKERDAASPVSPNRIADSEPDTDIPWFPKSKADLDLLNEAPLKYGADLSPNHPGFNDPAYKKRRSEIISIARTYQAGSPVPRIDYTKEEIETWGIVFRNLSKLFPTHASKEHRVAFRDLVQKGYFSADKIPQVEDISNYLKQQTGFTLRPVMGFVPPRDFLNGLALRVFPAAQYIRHHSQPQYTPEPDLCHELLGHAPLFADQEFADFSQEIGLASLGASDEDIEALAAIYWFTVEFGICKENGRLRAYGAALLSSFGELEYSLSGAPKRYPFDPQRIIKTSYPITEYQPLYFVADSFKEATLKFKEYAATINRPFRVSYNPQIDSIEVDEK